MMSDIKPEFVFPVDEAILLVARDVIRSSLNIGSFNMAFYRLCDLRSMVHFTLGPSHPLYSKIDAAMDEIPLGEWPKL